MLNLDRRYTEREEMDDLSLPKLELNRILNDLRKFNCLSNTAHILSKKIRLLLKDKKKTSIKILDIGCGGGDVLCNLVNSLEQKNFLATGLGIDINPQTIEHAKYYAKFKNVPVEFLTKDVISALAELKYDLVVSSLFLHHLSEETLIEIFSIIKKRASIGLIITDLERSKITYLITMLATKLISRSKIVHQDGLKSVRAAFTKKEFFDLSQRAGLNNCSINKIFPCNLLLSWQKN